MNIRKIASMAIVACAMFAASNVETMVEGGMAAFYVNPDMGPRGREEFERRGMPGIFEVLVPIVDVRENRGVLAIKEAIAKRYGISVDRQQLVAPGGSMYPSKILSDDTTLRELRRASGIVLKIDQ